CRCEIRVRGWTHLNLLFALGGQLHFPARLHAVPPNTEVRQVPIRLPVRAATTRCASRTASLVLPAAFVRVVEYKCGDGVDGVQQAGQGDHHLWEDLQVQCMALDRPVALPRQHVQAHDHHRRVITVQPLHCLADLVAVRAEGLRHHVRHDFEIVTKE
ncbi:hypothetical protein B484DRAFT_498, partial [Ochromonadaceae sp. CCMP2298]